MNIKSDKQITKDNNLLNSKIRRIIPYLICPSCHSDLIFKACELECCQCDQTYLVKNNKIYFIDVARPDDALDSVKGYLKKRFKTLYYKIGIPILAPTFPFNFYEQINSVVQSDFNIVINVGCGNHRLDDSIIGIDIFDYDAVDIVCDLQSLPLKNNSIDAFTSRSALEHMPYLNDVIEHLKRCTKKGGFGIHLIPFLYPFHASPNDYNRFTHMGQRQLFSSWKLIKQFNATGPVSLILICLIEFISILLSFGSDRIKAFMYLLLCILLFPIKFLDIFFVNRKSFLSLAPTIFIVVQKDNDS